MEQHGNEHKQERTDLEQENANIAVAQRRMPEGLLWAETQRICSSGLNFKCYYKNIPHMTVIAVQFPIKVDLTEKLEQLGYKPVEEELVKTYGLKHDPKRRMYFGIKDSTLLKKHGLS